MLLLHDSYCAGFFDGEGSAYLAQRSDRTAYSLLVCIANTNLEVLEEHKKQYGGSICGRIPKNPRHRKQYQWVLSSRQALPYLRAIQPYVIIKSEVVSAAIEFISLVSLPANQRLDYSNVRFDGRRYWSAPKRKPEYKDKVFALRDKIRELNARGYNARRNVTA